MAKAKVAGEGMNKRHMVQAAFEAKGDVSPGELQAYISATFGADLPASIVSTYKSILKSKRGLGKKNKKRGRPPGSAAKVAKAASGSTTVNLDELEAVSQLVRKMGGDKVIALVNLLQGFSK
jgi:hypothetical protein